MVYRENANQVVVQFTCNGLDSQYLISLLRLDNLFLNMGCKRPPYDRHIACAFIKCKLKKKKKKN